MGLPHKRNKGISVCFDLCKNNWLLSQETWVLDLLVCSLPALGKIPISGPQFLLTVKEVSGWSELTLAS
jgi:hypothetical protein